MRQKLPGEKLGHVGPSVRDQGAEDVPGLRPDIRTSSSSPSPPVFFLVCGFGDHGRLTPWVYLLTSEGADNKYYNAALAEDAETLRLLGNREERHCASFKHVDRGKMTESTKTLVVRFDMQSADYGLEKKHSIRINHKCHFGGIQAVQNAIATGKSTLAIASPKAPSLLRCRATVLVRPTKQRWPGVSYSKRGLDRGDCLRREGLEVRTMLGL